MHLIKFLSSVIEVLFWPAKLGDHRAEIAPLGGYPLIVCLEEIAYRMGYIERSRLRKLASQLANSEYGRYLEKIADQEVSRIGRNKHQPSTGTF